MAYADKTAFNNRERKPHLPDVDSHSVSTDDYETTPDSPLSKDKLKLKRDASNRALSPNEPSGETAAVKSLI